MDQNHVTKRILNLTLEIIALLTGETFTAVKSGDLVAIMAPSHYFVLPEKTNKKKILEVTDKIIELLTEEVPMRCHDVTERQYLGEHKELYKAAMMEDQPVDGSRKRKRCPRPQYSRDATQDEEIPHHNQGDVLLNIKVEDLEEEELYEKCARQCKEEVIQEMDSDEVGMTLGVHPAPSPDSDMEDKSFTRDCLRGIIQSKADGPSNSKESFPKKSLATPPIIHTGSHRLSDEAMTSSLSMAEGLSFHLTPHSAGSSSDCCNVGHNSVFMTQDHSSSEESSPDKSLTPPPNIHPKPHRSSDQSMESSLGASKGVALPPDPSGDNKLYPCCQCGKTFMLQLLFGGRQRTDREPFTCCECQNRSNAAKSPRSAPQETDEAGAKYFACPKCPKTFSRKTYLVHHQRIHREDSNYSCSECGRCFTNKSNLVVHARTHTGERPFPCFMCGKNFTHRSSLVRHLRAHMR